MASSLRDIMSASSTASSSNQNRIQLRLEANLRQIFWQDSSVRRTAFFEIEQCLKQLLPVGIHYPSTLFLLEKSYTEAPNLHIDTSMKLIEIITMISTRSGHPDFFSVVEVVTVLLGIISQHTASQFDAAVERMFYRFSDSLNMVSVSQSSMTDYSRETIKMFLPNENEILLSAGKALCLKAMVGTVIWQYGSQTEIEYIWDCVRITIETGRIEAVHASLARKIIATGFVGVVHPLNNVELGAMLKAVVRPLNNAANASDVGFCRVLCGLINSILSHQSVIKYFRAILVTDLDYVVRNLVDLRLTLDKCNFSNSRVFLDAVTWAKAAVDSVLLPS